MRHSLIAASVAERNSRRASTSTTSAVVMILVCVALADVVLTAFLFGD